VSKSIVVLHCTSLWQVCFGHTCGHRFDFQRWRFAARGGPGGQWGILTGQWGILTGQWGILTGPPQSCVGPRRAERRGVQTARRPTRG
jgi:hypothetical protein